MISGFEERAVTSLRNAEHQAAAKAKGAWFPLPWLWFCLVALVISVLVPMRIGEVDIWYHLRNAQQFLTTHTFLRADTYTFTSAGAALLNHEWLAELPYYIGFREFGLRGLAAVNVMVLCLVFGGMYYLACRRGADCGDAALVAVAAVILGMYTAGPRMHNFGYLCLTVLLIALERFQETGKGLWLLPPLFAVWINLHGSWVFGIVVIGIYLVSGLVKHGHGRVEAEPWKPGQLRTFLLVTAASAAALLVNPYGYKLVLYPFDLLFRQQANMGNVIEWQPVDFHNVYGKMALLLLFVVLATGLLSERKWAVRDVLLLGFALWMGLMHARFLQFAAIVMVPILAPQLRMCPPYEPSSDNSWRNLLAGVAIVALIIGGFPTSARLSPTIDQGFPRDALHFMQQNHLTGRLFHKYEFGGYIEWYAPEIKTFADGRTDIFVYNGVFDDYLQIGQVKHPLEVLDKYKIEYVLFPPETSLSYVLDHSPQWRVMYEDRVAKLYERAPTTAAASRP